MKVRYYNTLKIEVRWYFLHLARVDSYKQGNIANDLIRMCHDVICFAFATRTIDVPGEFDFWLQTCITRLH